MKTPETLKLEKRRDNLLAARGVVRMSERVWTSVLYDVSNVTMIVGDDGIILVDTGMIPDNARTTLQEFRKITDKPVKAVIYTHGHGDHTGGSSVFAAEGEEVEVWARSNFGAETLPFEQAGLMPLFAGRGARQGGFNLPPEKRICNGVSLVMYPKAKGAIFSGKTGAVMPNRLFAGERMELRLCGVDLELLATPGETSDALAVWIPSEKVLCAGDDIYRSFPNVYPVRGTPPRDLQSWIASLERMMEYDAAGLVPGHTAPFLGAEEARSALINYRDALKHIFDATLEGMRQGLGPDELVRVVKLPPHLAELDDLGEYYGNIAWTVRGIYSAYIGWFGNDPLELTVFGAREEARGMAELAGGEAALAGRAREELAKGNALWASRLASHLLALDPENREYRALKADTLDAVAETILTATGRNYAYTVAQELRRTED